MTIKTRLTKLEKQGRGPGTAELYPLDKWNRSMDILAELLGITRAELDNGLDAINHEQP